jgi:hypothetical protein
MNEETLHQMSIDLAIVKTKIDQMPSVQELHDMVAKVQQAIAIIEPMESVLKVFGHSLKWLGGIIAAVITGLTVALATRLI